MGEFLSEEYRYISKRERERDCITTHKSQGSNYSVVFIDMENVITCNQNKKESLNVYIQLLQELLNTNILM